MKKRNRYIYILHFMDFEDKIGATSSVIKRKGKQIFKAVYKHKLITTN